MTVVYDHGTTCLVKLAVTFHLGKCPAGHMLISVYHMSTVYAQLSHNPKSHAAYKSTRWSEHPLKRHYIIPPDHLICTVKSKLYGSTIRACTSMH